MSTSNRRTLVTSVTTILGERHREIALLGGLLVSTFVMLALMSFDGSDPTLLHPGPGAVVNICGPLGALLADIFFSTLGYGAYATFGLMVTCALSLAGREILGWWRWLASLALFSSLLGLMHLALGPGERFAPGGFIGLWEVSLLEAVAGRAGAWMGILGFGLLAATVLFRIRWRRVFAKGMDLVEWVAPIVKEWTVWAMAFLGAQLRVQTHKTAIMAGVSTKAAGQRLWHTFCRMGRSLMRKDGDYEPEWSHVSSLEDLDQEPDVFDERSRGDTVVGGPSAVAEVEWEPTATVTGAVLSLYPEMAPRDGRCSDTLPDFDELISDPEHTQPEAPSVLA
ncbi:MAG: hypothetical protein HN348_18380, partial [Proteobacteria bacterium]|nr:hypothetical protein [Pseudomonadota bacterium]